MGVSKLNDRPISAYQKNIVSSSKEILHSVSTLKAYYL